MDLRPYRRQAFQHTSKDILILNIFIKRYFFKIFSLEEPDFSSSSYFFGLKFKFRIDDQCFISKTFKTSPEIQISQAT
jgi:hypothetical protein